MRPLDEETVSHNVLFNQFRELHFDEYLRPVVSCRYGRRSPPVRLCTALGASRCQRVTDWLCWRRCRGLAIGEGISPAALWIINVRLPDLSGFDLTEMLRSSLGECRFVLVADAYDFADERQCFRWV